MSQVDERYRGPWPDVRGLVHAALTDYLRDVEDPATHALPTRCEPWTVADVTAHMAATYARFAAMIERGRAGDLSPPFARSELDAVNAAAVEAFDGDPVKSLHHEVEGFLTLTGDMDEVMPHQRGPIPVGLQIHFGLAELVLHRLDVIEAVEPARARWFRPPDATTAALVPVFKALGAGDPPERDPWPWMIEVSGRPDVGSRGG